ncbi:MAG TPA: hypothetical protein PLS98_07540 [Dictyoglomaceae bacterium]|nr:hypothetical protein [Dictyoglomaceae bacterium]
MYKVSIRNAETNELLFNVNTEMLHLEVRKSTDSSATSILYDVTFAIPNDGAQSCITTLEPIINTNVNLEIYKDSNKLFSNNDNPLSLENVGSNLGGIIEELHIVFRKG